MYRYGNGNRNTEFRIFQRADKSSETFREIVNGYRQGCEQAHPIKLLEFGGLFRDIDVSNESYYEGLFALSGDEGQLGDMSILLSQKESKENVRQMLFWLLIIAAACLACVAPFTWFFANSIAKPIQHAIDGLTEGAEQISAAANEVSNASQSLAESSSEQAAANGHAEHKGRQDQCGGIGRVA